jgi:prolipoprotein diacylglyceryltransferase
MNLLVVLLFALPLVALFAWGFRKLPQARWQMLGTVPVVQKDHNTWQGINFTFYGVFNALAYTLAVALAIVLLQSIDLAPFSLFAIIIGILGICMPASRIVAAVVEKKPHTFSVGGATFVGILVAPWLVLAVNQFTSRPMPIIPVLGVMALAYAMGEGLGRLACISFGCCYGRPVADLPEPWRRLFSRHAFVFGGTTKKISYAHHLDGQPVVPIQAMTAVIYCGWSLGGTYLFLEGYFAAALVLSILVTQVWRFLSEFLRHDYRGEGSISAYQVMALVGAAYTLVLPFLIPAENPPVPHVLHGLAALWSPGIILALQCLWVISFVYTGKSHVTEASIRFRVRKEHI